MEGYLNITIALIFDHFQANSTTSVPAVPGVKVVESEGDESEEEESEILEESPCGRWLKRREEVGHIMIMILHHHHPKEEVLKQF